MAPLTRFAGCAALAVVLAASACVGSGEDEDVQITDAWARPSPSGVTTGAAYMTIHSATDDVLLGATVEADVAASVELHATTSAGGVSTMAPSGDLTLPAGEDVTIEPGGNHIMLVDLASPLVAGDSFPLTLRLAEQGARTVDVAVGDGPP